MKDRLIVWLLKHITGDALRKDVATRVLENRSEIMYSVLLADLEYTFEMFRANGGSLDQAQADTVIESATRLAQAQVVADFE